jgi:hypothetical protein
MRGEASVYEPEHGGADRRGRDGTRQQTWEEAGRDWGQLEYEGARQGSNVHEDRKEGLIQRSRITREGARLEVAGDKKEELGLSFQPKKEKWEVGLAISSNLSDSGKG